MKTRKFCPRCGRPVVKSCTKGYAFQCFGCDEDFYRMEVFGKKDLAEVKRLRRAVYLWERVKKLPRISFKKPYPRRRD